MHPKSKDKISFSIFLTSRVWPHQAKNKGKNKWSAKNIKDCFLFVVSYNFGPKECKIHILSMYVWLNSQASIVY